jgi:N-acetylglucosamine kinase-like BadF-type ATPase
VERLFLGVDAGNSKTLAVVGDESGRILGWGRSGLGDIYGADLPDLAVDEVFLAIAAATSMAGSGAMPHGAAFRLAGVDWPEDEQFWSAAIVERFGEPIRFSVKNDGFALMRCGDPRGVGVALSVGTGAAMAGRGIGGEEFIVSWWFQHHLGAAGLGHDALRAVMLAELGMGSATALTAELCRFYGVGSAEELLHAFTKRVDNLGHRDKARAARTVLAAASNGDAISLEIVRKHAGHLTKYAVVTARQVGFDIGADLIPLVLGGSVLTAHHSILRALLVESLRADASNFQVIDSPGASPVLGALLDAMAENGVDVTAQLQTTVLQQQPPDGFFDT